jgi:hypothetical protein
MNSNIQDEKIESFWQWFAQNDTFIKNSIQSESLPERNEIVEKMNNFILDLGLFSWDLGLDDDNNWFLTISPNNDKELFVLSKRIIAEAPDHLDWIYHASKPAKKRNADLRVYDEYLEEVTIFPENWHFIATHEEDGTYNLEIETGELPHLDLETADFAVHLFLQNEIGEEAKITRVHNILRKNQFDLALQTEKKHVSQLKKLFL